MAENNKKELIEKAEQVLCELRPHLWADEGDVKILDITSNHELVVQWLGACKKCELSNITLKYGIKQAVMEQLEEITDVIVAETE